MSRREIVLDTETTGLSPAQGHRIIEIGCLELLDRLPTGRTFHSYINPRRDVDPGAEAVHGLTREFLSDKPPFKSIYQDFFDFIEGASLIIHNAPFDCGFIDYEFRRQKKAHPSIYKLCPVIDTLAIARNKHPGQRNNLDALCKRYKIDNSKRDYHGALLDAEILAKVYLQMTGGQDSLFDSLSFNTSHTSAPIQRNDTRKINNEALIVQRASQEELNAHEQYMSQLKESEQSS